MSKFSPVIPLAANDVIALACPGSYAAAENEAAQVSEYLNCQYGWTVLYREDTYSRLSAQQRAEIFLEYLFNPAIKLIWALRGGEGTADIVPLLEKHCDEIRRLPPKLLLGFSDITVLLIYFQQNYGWPVIHGMGAGQLVGTKVEAYSKQLTCDLLTGKCQQIVVSDLQPLNAEARHCSFIQAPLSGGNLSLLDISIKDCWEFDACDRIVIIEDVHEKAHKISRTLKYLQRIGKFSGVKALVLGDFLGVPLGCSEQEIAANAKAIQDTLPEFAAGCEFPVFSSSLFGHGAINYPLCFGPPAVIECAASLQMRVANPFSG